MWLESRERARRNPARYPRQNNQRPSVKRRAPRLVNRGAVIGKDCGPAPRRRNRLRGRQGARRVSLWRRLHMLLGRK